MADLAMGGGFFIFFQDRVESTKLKPITYNNKYKILRREDEDIAKFIMLLLEREIL